MIPHHEVKREELFGQLQSSLNYSKQMLSKKNVSTEDKIAYGKVKDHFTYYMNKKVDPEFLIEMIDYHFYEAMDRYEVPKTVLTSDKVQSKIVNGEIKVITRLATLRA